MFLEILHNTLIFKIKYIYDITITSSNSWIGLIKVNPLTSNLDRVDGRSKLQNIVCYLERKITTVSLSDHLLPQHGAIVLRSSCNILHHHLASPPKPSTSHSFEVFLSPIYFLFTSQRFFIEQKCPYSTINYSTVSVPIGSYPL